MDSMRFRRGEVPDGSKIYGMSRFLLRGFLLAALVGGLGVVSAQAQFPGLGGGGGRNANGPGTSDRGLGIGTYDTKTVTRERVLTGMVKGKDGQPLKGAIVYLKNDSTKDMKSVTVDATGKFRFGQLSRTADYQLWAVNKDKKTDPKVISQFDTRDSINRELNVE